MKKKHAEDIWTLVGAIRRCERVPHTLLRNGKRAKDEWWKSQEVRKEGGMLNDVGSLANKEIKNCEAVGLGGGTEARVIDEEMDPECNPTRY